MKIERRKNRTAEVYTSSLNDIMFFLLLFFLIISTMVTPAAIKVMLPKASAAKEVTLKKSVQLVITSEQRYYIDDREITFEQIESELSQIMNAKKEDEEIDVILQADSSLPLQQVVNVINIGYKMQIKMILFAKKEA